MKTVLKLQQMHQAQQKITMVTCYDYWSAKLIARSEIDCILVGDSVAMTMHGFDTTVSATVDMMAMHVAAVARGARNKFIIGDLPFLAHRQGRALAMQAVQRLMQAGAQAVKLEGADGHCDIVKWIVDSGVPVMGHLGLTPQSVNQLSGYRVQGRNQQQADKMLEDALALQAAGCFAIVLECVPAPLAINITQQLAIPTIGIGAGPGTSGQVLVLQDLLGLNETANFKFLKKYLNGAELILDALERYDSDVKNGCYPNQEHAFN